MDGPDNLRVKDFSSEDLPSIWSQDKQHVAQYLGKFLFCPNEKNQLQWQLPEYFITVV